MSNLSSEIGSMKKEHSMQDEEITIKPIGFVKISRVGFPIIKEIKFKMFGTIGHNSTLKPQKKKLMKLLSKRINVFFCYWKPLTSSNLCVLHESL